MQPDGDRDDYDAAQKAAVTLMRSHLQVVSSARSAASHRQSKTKSPKIPCNKNRSEREEEI